jgi:hypothetical protein
MIETGAYVYYMVYENRQTMYRPEHEMLYGKLDNEYKGQVNCCITKKKKIGFNDFKVRCAISMQRYRENSNT